MLFSITAVDLECLLGIYVFLLNNSFFLNDEVGSLKKE